MKCPRCQVKAPAGAEFCPECGTGLAGVCPQCGTQKVAVLRRSAYPVAEF